MSNKDLSKPISQFVRKVDTIVYIDETIEDALKRIRKKKIDLKIIYFYVLDSEEKLRGYVPTRAFLLNDPSAPIKKIMSTSIVSLTSDQKLQKAIELLESNRLLALPVVNEDKQFVGVIDVDFYLEESVDVAREKRRSDVFQLIGMVIEDKKKVSPFKSYKSRMPWITCNIFGGISCAIISRVYELVLSEVIILAMFIPLLLTLSESISMQSMTQSMQSLPKKSLRMKAALKRVVSELKVVLLLSVTSAVSVGLLSLCWGQGIGPALTIGIGILFGIFFSASFGALVPIILHKRNWDPKVAAGPVVLMFADVFTTALYLSIATWWLL